MHHEREFAVDVVRRLRQSGYEALFVGGCVRDELLGLVPADYDVATSARPEQVEAVFRRTIAVGASFGVIEVIGPRRSDGTHPKVQVATFRNDGQYLDGRRPESVQFSSAQEDAQRRDFTINGMFLDPLDGRIIDYVGGQEDLQRRLLRAIGNPLDRFREDKLRLLRAIRMASRFDFPIEPVTANAIQEMAKELTVVSAERIAEELRKILVHRSRASALRTMDRLGLLQSALPEATTELKGTSDATGSDLWEKALGTVEALNLAGTPGISFPLAFAAVLHDVGMRRSAAQVEGRVEHPQHERAGKKLVAGTGRRLKLSVAEMSRIEWLVEQHHALDAAMSMKPSKLYPLLVHQGITELLTLHRAIASASNRTADHVDFCEQLIRDVPPEVLCPPPLITGDDLVALGWAQGPVFKKALDAVREAQLDGLIKTREQALELAEEQR